MAVQKIGFLCEVADDKLSATLNMTNIYDMKLMTSDAIMSAINLAGVKFGIDEGLIKQVISAPEDYYRQTLKIASAKLAVNGVPAKVRFAFTNPTMEQRPLERDNGSVDFKELRRLNNIRMGQFLAEWLPAVPGELGMNVNGEAIQPEKQADERIAPGTNTVWNADKTKLYATADGLATITTDRKVHVFPCYEIDGNVDYSEGHVDFFGTVHINGDIMPGFRVKAGGDVLIKGNCDGGSIEAGGSIMVMGGIIGAPDQIIRAGVDLHALYVLEGELFAARDVVVTQSIMRSKIEAGNTVRCDGAKSLVVGGNIYAGEMMSFQTVGNVSESHTNLYLGLFPLLRLEADEIKEKLTPLRSKLEQIANAILLLERLSNVQRLNSQQLQMMDQLQTNRKQLQFDLYQYSERWAELQLFFERAMEGYIEVKKSTFPGTIINIGRQSMTVRDTAGKAVFRWISGAVRQINQ